jgi:hypothetical protein
MLKFRHQKCVPFLGFCALSWACPYQKKLLKRKMENFVKNLDHVGVEFIPRPNLKIFHANMTHSPSPHFALLLPPPYKNHHHFFATISKHHFFEKINPPKNLNVVKKFSILSFFLPSGKFEN